MSRTVTQDAAARVVTAGNANFQVTPVALTKGSDKKCYLVVLPLTTMRDGLFGPFNNAIGGNGRSTPSPRRSDDRRRARRNGGAARGVLVSVPRSAGLGLLRHSAADNAAQYPYPLHAGVLAPHVGYRTNQRAIALLVHDASPRRADLMGCHQSALRGFVLIWAKYMNVISRSHRVRPCYN
jgi:hypothetical protein